ncbi:hypothetical protein [Bradyrhizobium sp. AUGA SZCCT0182]|uniref:hypothetical protein n=1 Tax=Bradyrhizobium sp. AUGA SZCCT0182 TaxID=2807667 RepID=UPI001BA6E452|nr:hypothetical protein [Bradyrhizobium sp. AUGA SZCCT0182]MBR1235407.1 hypothetical protein [Bradyrhizobium sp. AUGA SZCCT0182]
MSDDAARFRNQADECREQAERAINPLDKERWLRLSEEWLKMTASAEKDNGKPPQLAGSCWQMGKRPRRGDHHRTKAANPVGVFYR